MFTARNRQNVFAKRRREQKAAEAAAETPPVPVSVPVDLNPDSAEYTQAPDISTYATGGAVPQTTVEDVVIGEHGPEHLVPLSNISADTQAKIDAVMNHAIPPVADERPDYPGPRGAEIMRKPADAPTTSDELIASITDPGPAPVVEPETPPEDEPKRGRGRPRPQETIDRDNAVHGYLVEAGDDGLSKEQLAEKTKEKEQQVYSSLRQLSKEGRAENRYVKPHGYRWFAA